MPKIKNYSRDDRAYPAWENDIKGDRIATGPANRTDYTSGGYTKEYQVTNWARDELNNHVVSAIFSSKKQV